VASFERAVEFVLDHEGAETNDPADLGGRTRFGFSQRAWPHLDLDRLTRADAIELYRSQFWDRIRGDALPEALGLAMLDFAVLQGLPTAVRALQGLLGVHPDGKVGPLTLAAIDARAPGPLVRELLALRKRQLLAIGDRRFLAGWLSRLVDLALEV